MASPDNDTAENSGFRCRACGGHEIGTVLDLGEQPDPDRFPLVGEGAAPTRTEIRAGVCRDCWLVQLVGDYALAEEKQIGVQSASSKRYAGRTVPALVASLGLPAGARYREHHSPHGEDWGAELRAAGLKASEGDAPADLVVDLYGAMHRADLPAALDELVTGLAPDGNLVMETQYWLTTVTNGQFDTVRNGHPVYLSLSALVPMLQARGLGVVSATTNELHGAGLQIIARPGAPTGSSVEALLAAEAAAGLRDWPPTCDLQQRADIAAKSLRSFLTEAKREGRKVVGYGAPTRSIVLLNYAGITSDLLPFTADMSEYKQGRLVPGTDIEIVRPDRLRELRPDDVLVLTYDIVEEVKAQYADLESTNFWVPLPEPTLV